MYKCKICGKEFETKQKLGGHTSSHNRGESYKESRMVTGIRKYNRERKEYGEYRPCKFCGKPFSPNSIGGHVSRCELNPNSEKTHSLVSIAHIGKKISNESIKKISDSMKKAHLEGRAWNIGKSRWNSIKSYPEQFFEKVINNEFDNKNYKMEYPIGIYSLDFAWVDLKRAIEIDGEQHDRFEEYHQRDIRKDEFCKSSGWEILRIKWKELYSNTKEKIKEANSFINKLP